MENSTQHTQPKEKRKWLLWGIGVIVLIIIISISSSPEEKTQENVLSTEQNQIETEKIVYQISGEGKSISDSKIALEGVTNLPNDSVLKIKVDRISIWKGENVERFFTVASGDTVVNNGIYKTEISIDDRKFVEFEKNSGEIIKEVNENVEVSIIFDPSATQPQNVTNKVGSKGQKLDSSPQKKVFGSATPSPVNRLDIDFRVEMPFLFMDELPK